MIALLQIEYDFFKEPDPNVTIITLSVFAGLILFAVIASLLSKKKSGSAKKGGSSQNYSRFAFRRKAKKIGLNQNHVELLQQMISKYKIQNPERLLHNSPLLTGTMKKMISEIEIAEGIEEVKENKKYLLFQLKRIIENNSETSTTLSSTRQLKKGQELRITPKGGPSYESGVISKLRDMLGIEVPLDRRGQEVRWKKGTRLHISAILDRNRIFSFNTKVLGYNTFQRESILFTEHAQNIKQTQKRRSQRKELDRPCYFFPVEIMSMTEGRKTVKRAMLNKNLRHLGTMVDISAGGCCIKARNPLKAASLLKIEFETQRRVHVTVFGKVRGVDQDPPHGGYMHVMFTRISKKNLNKIQEYVYEIDKEQVVYY